MSLAADNSPTPGRNRLPRPDPAAIARVRDALDRHGKTVSDWARENKENAWSVHKVLSGKVSIASGARHRIAVKLGLKDGTIDGDAGMEPAR